VLPSNKLREEQVLAELELLFPSWTSDSDRSDMRQLTRAIAGGVTYFVTRDERVRDQAEQLYNTYGLVVVSPFELVLEFDELRREEEYRPKRFVSVGLKTVKPRGPEDLERIADLMHLGQRLRSREDARSVGCATSWLPQTVSISPASRATMERSSRLCS